MCVFTRIQNVLFLASKWLGVPICKYHACLCLLTPLRLRPNNPLKTLASIQPIINTYNREQHGNAYCWRCQNFEGLNLPSPPVLIINIDSGFLSSVTRLYVLLYLVYNSEVNCIRIRKVYVHKIIHSTRNDAYKSAPPPAVVYILLLIDSQYLSALTWTSVICFSVFMYSCLLSFLMEFSYWLHTKKTKKTNNLFSF